VTAMLQAGVNVKVADVIIAASGSIWVANSLSLANSNSIGSGASSAGLRTLG